MYYGTGFGMRDTLVLNHESLVMALLSMGVPAAKHSAYRYLMATFDPTPDTDTHHLERCHSWLESCYA